MLTPSSFAALDLQNIRKISRVFINASIKRFLSKMLIGFLGKITISLPRNSRM